MKIRDDHGASRGINQNSRPVNPLRSDKGSDLKGFGWSGGDRLELSDRARALSVARESMASSSLIQADKIDTLKQAIMDGTYHVPAEEIAGRMLGEGFLA
jgi:flagellar biosynthesis anti-sigma factor FlgM